MSKVKVILLSEIKYGKTVDGVLKYFRFAPSKIGEPMKHTMIPQDLYDSLKGAKPPVFKLAEEVVVDDVIEDGGDVVTLQQSAVKADAETNGKVAALPDLNMVDASELTDEDPAPAPAPVVSSDPDNAISVELQKIKGIGAGVAKTLIAANYKTVADVAYATDEALAALDGISEKTVVGIKESALEITEQ